MRLESASRVRRGLVCARVALRRGLARARVALSRGLVCALAAACWACASAEERFEGHLLRAEELVAERRVEDALIELQRALVIDPQSAEVNQRLAELLERKGAYQLAVLHYGEAYRLDPSRVEATLREVALTRNSQPRAADRLIERARKRHPESPGVFRADAALALVLGDPVRALASAQRAIELAPEQAESWLELGRVHRARAGEAGDAPDAALQSALDAYARAETQGEELAARLEMARVHAAWPGHESEAAAAFRLAVERAGALGDPAAYRRAATAFERHARQQRDPELRREALRHRVAAAPDQLASWERLAALTEQLDGRGAAESIYRELIAAQPGSAAAHLHFSAYLAQTGRAAEAAAHLGGVADGGLDHPLLGEQLVRLELSRGRLAEARVHLAALAQRHPDDPLTRRGHARVALAEGRPDDAAAWLGDTGAERPDAETEALRAQVELARGRPEAAQAAANLAVDLTPGFSAPALRLQAAVHAETEAWAPALAALEELTAHGVALTDAERLTHARALYARGDEARGRAGLLELLARADAPPAAAVEFARRETEADADAARRHLEAAHARAPGHFGVLEGLTRLDLAADRGARALGRIDGVVGARQAGPRALLLRAEVLARTGQLPRAEADALRALELTPDLPRAVDLLIAIYSAQDRVEEARHSFVEAESAGVLHGGARLLLARLHLVRGDVAAARNIYERVVDEHPEIAAARNDLAFLLASRGEQLELALDLAQQARRALPRNANTADTLGFVYLELGRHADALAQFHAALAHAPPGDPSLPTFHYHLGLTLEALERSDEARSRYERALALDASFPGAADARARLGRPRRAADGRG